MFIPIRMSSQINYSTPDKIPAPPPGFKLLMPGDILPKGYVYLNDDDKTWTHYRNEDWVGKPLNPVSFRPIAGPIDFTEKLLRSLRMIQHATRPGTNSAYHEAAFEIASDALDEYEQTRVK